jgi:hypothetical protein
MKMAMLTKMILLLMMQLNGMTAMVMDTAITRLETMQIHSQMIILNGKILTMME